MLEHPSACKAWACWGVGVVARVVALLAGRPWTAEQKQRLATACSMAHHQANAMLAILETAHQNDQGRLYRAVGKKYNKLLVS